MYPMSTTPPTSHNIEAALEQAKHLARLRIAERCKVDLFYLCHEVLGYEAMTERTHGELCAVTKTLLPSYVKQLSVEGDAHSTMDDANKYRTRPDLTPHSHPLEPQPTTSSYLNQPADASQNILPEEIGQNSQFENPLVEPLVPENTGLYKDNIKWSMNEFPLPFDPDKKALHIEMPRGTFKSSVVTIGFALQFILNDPNGRVLIDSETYSKSKNFLAELKGHLESNDKFREVYFTLYGVMPDANKRDTSVRWTDAAIDLSCRTKVTKEASFMVSGIDKSINGMHYDLIVGDDLHSETNVTNREAIEKVIQHYKLLLSLLDPDRYLIIIGTRWHHFDMYQHLIKNEQFRFNFYVRRAKNKDGTLLFPERLHEKFLAEQRKSQGSYLYSCQYMNEPVDDEDATFKYSYMITRPWNVIEPIPINWYMSVDPSSEGSKGQSDFAAIAVAGLDALSNLYVRHIMRKKMKYSELIEQIFYIYLLYRPKEIVIETIASANSIQYMLSQEMKRRGIFLPIKYISGRNTNKEVRIEGLEPFYKYGRAIHVLECPQREDLEDELVQFPVGENDDAIDALATILEVAKAAKFVKDPEEREKRKAKIDKLTKPRSPLTRV